MTTKRIYLLIEMKYQDRGECDYGSLQGVVNAKVNDEL